MAFVIMVRENKGLDSPVCLHWEKAKYFCIFDEEGNCEIYEKKSEEFFLKTLKEKNVRGAFALSLGLRAINLLNKMNITVYTGDFRTVREAIEKYVSKELSVVKIIYEPIK